MQRKTPLFFTLPGAKQSCDAAMWCIVLVIYARTVAHSNCFEPLIRFRLPTKVAEFADQSRRVC